MNQSIEITIQNKTFCYPSGTTIKGILLFSDILLEDEYQKNPIIAAKVNYELMSLSKHVIDDAIIEPIYLFSNLGKRIYRKSMCYLLCAASQSIFPERRLRISHSLGDGYYFHYSKFTDFDKEDVELISEEMRRLVDEKVNIDVKYVPYQKTVDYFMNRNHGFSQTVEVLKYEHTANVELYCLKDFMDRSNEPIVYNTSIISMWELRKYNKNGMLLRYPRSSDFTKLQPFKENPLLFSVFQEYKKWNSILEMESIGQLDAYCLNNNISRYIRLAETLQWKKISAIADMIHEKGTVKAILVAGPSSSGKTTFTHKLGINLTVMGLKPILISLDNYYKTSPDIPLNEKGEKDYESLEALDIKYFQENIRDLYDGKEVVLPVFNFKKGVRENSASPTKMEDNTIFIIEGIHGLNPKILPDIDTKTTFKVYISALTQLNIDDHNRVSTTDNRILRRITRDHMTRGVSAETTLKMWNNVNKGENKHIFPFQNNADVMLNSAVDYELGALKPIVESLLKTIEPSNDESFAVATRLLNILQKVYPIPSELVPKDALIREFIGGSEFNVT
jgi:uridine kinase